MKNSRIYMILTHAWLMFSWLMFSMSRINFEIGCYAGLVMAVVCYVYFSYWKAKEEASKKKIFAK